MIYLASKSPRRSKLLKQLDVEFEILNIDIVEKWNETETATEFVCRLALEKARAGNKIS